MTPSNTYTEKEIFNRWFPLVVGRFCMVLEIPITAFALSHLANPEASLAAFGALFIPITYFCEASFWNLIGSSASLVRCKEDLHVLRKYLYLLYGLVLLVFLTLFETPIVDNFIIPFFGTTRELFEMARPSIFIGATLPFLVGYRRINHGVLIHVGKSKCVSSTSFIRILILTLSLLGFHFSGTSLSGNTLVAISIMMSYIVETVVSDLFVRKYALPSLLNTATSLTVKSTWIFCSPMIFSSLVAQIMLPVGAAILFRLPESRLSLVVWPAVSGFLQLARTPGSAFIELTASIGDNSENFKRMKKFAHKVALGLFIFLLVFTLSGTSNYYFRTVGGLSEEFANFAAKTLMFGVLFPALESRLWFLTGAAYALRMTKLGAQATVIATTLGLSLYLIALNQTLVSGATFVVLMWTICTLAESTYFSVRINRAKSSVPNLG